jgi:hypothetical protein
VDQGEVVRVVLVVLVGFLVLLGPDQPHRECGGVTPTVPIQDLEEMVNLELAVVVVDTV